MDKLDFLSIETHGCIGIITLNHPPQNSIPTPDFADLETLTSFLNLPEYKGFIITGNGRHFSVGAQLENLASLIKIPQALEESLNYGKALLQLIENVNLPVVSAIKGICFGGGLEIALASHIRVCSDRALFAFPEINHNLMPGLGGTVKLQELLSVADALNLFLSGDTVDAEKAKEMKLVDYVVSPNNVLDFSIQLLNNLVVDRPKYVIEAIMKAISNAQKLPFNQALDEETRLFCHLAAKANL